VKGYVYITSTGTDPALRNNLSDPLFTRIPTLGACMPNIRRNVVRGDWIFVVSGRVSAVQQYVVGGLRVAEKIDALAAYERFPENRLQQSNEGRIQGNIIVTGDGRHHPLDNHSSESFDERIKNFIVGSESMSLDTSAEVALGREQTLPKLSELLGKPGNRAIDVMSRWSKLDDGQVDDILTWLKEIKLAAARP
jgi:Nucleotide modification associated domain 2